MLRGKTTVEAQGRGHARECVAAAQARGGDPARPPLPAAPSGRTAACASALRPRRQARDVATWGRLGFMMVSASGG